jgi:hypothetical protein
LAGFDAVLLPDLSGQNDLAFRRHGGFHRRKIASYIATSRNSG